MSVPRPRVSVINSNDEIVLALRDLLDEAGYDVSTGHVFDFKTGKRSLIDFLEQWDPQVVVFDVAPPYDTNWHFLEHIRGLGIMKGRGVIVTTTNKRALAEIAKGRSHAIELLGKPEDMHEIVDAVKRALARLEAA